MHLTVAITEYGCDSGCEGIAFIAEDGTTYGFSFLWDRDNVEEWATKVLSTLQADNPELVGATWEICPSVKDR